MKRIISIGIIIGALASTLAASNIELDGVGLTSKCLGCHGQSFEKKALNKSLIVSEMSKEDIEKSLLGYKDGTYGKDMKALMKSQVANLTEEEIKFMAEYIISLKK